MNRSLMVNHHHVMTLVPGRHASPLPRHLTGGVEDRARISRQLCLAGGLLVIAFIILIRGCWPGEDEAGLTLATSAEVVVANPSGFTWRIALQPLADANAFNHPAVPWIQVAPRAVLRLKPTAGVYRVHRQWVDVEGRTTPAGTSADSTELTFDAGRTYHWPLATLLSGEEDAP